MKIEDHNQLVQDLLANLNDQGKVSDIILKFTEDNKKMEESFTTLNTELEDVKKYNVSLKEANNRVLTQLTANVPVQSTPDPVQGTPDPVPVTPDPEQDLKDLIASSGLI